MEYCKKFCCVEELNVFVDFHKKETGLLFSSNCEMKTAWIEVDEKVYQELKDADMFD